jgi:O-antigen/teichoic acid export membrane protein
VLVATSASSIAYPAVAQAGALTGGWKLTLRFVLIVTSINIAVAVTLCLAMPLLVRFLFGEEFEGAIVLAQLLIIATVFFGTRKILSECIRGLGNPAVSSYSEVSMWPWLAIFLPPMMSAFGAIGLAAGIAGAHAFALILTIGWAAILYRRQSRVSRGNGR